MYRQANSVQRSRSGIRYLEFLWTFTVCVSSAAPLIAQQIASFGSPQGSATSTLIAEPEPQPGNVSGTVTDVDNDLIPGATVVLESPALREHLTVVANDNGAFDFNNLKAGVQYCLTISAHGFSTWTSSSFILHPGQFLILTDGKLKFAGETSSVNVYASSEQIAVEQVRVEEQQRVLGFIPNFWVAYGHNAVPLTAKLKFNVALKASTDPVIFLGAASMAAVNQAADRLDYVQGAKGYGQRLGVAYTDVFVNLIIGSAILPSIFRQDPRYFYQGSGTTRSRALHALSSPFICKGDNGRWQPNYSSIGGDLATGAISNIYYPASNRGPGLVFEGTLISTGGRIIEGLMQEFILRRLTPSARHRN